MMFVFKAQAVVENAFLIGFHNEFDLFADAGDVRNQPPDDIGSNFSSTELQFKVIETRYWLEISIRKQPF